jgi:hypothetical protein
MVTSVSGFRVLPKKGEYASAIAFFSRGLPFCTCQPRLPSVGLAGCSTCFCWRVLVAVDAVQGRFSSICDEFRRIIATGAVSRELKRVILLTPYSQEALAHVHNGLHWRSCCAFIDNRPIQCLVRPYKEVNVLTRHLVAAQRLFLPAEMGHSAQLLRTWCAETTRCAAWSGRAGMLGAKGPKGAVWMLSAVAGA